MQLLDAAGGAFAQLVPGQAAGPYRRGKLAGAELELGQLVGLRRPERVGGQPLPHRAHRLVHPRRQARALRPDHAVGHVKALPSNSLGTSPNGSPTCWRSVSSGIPAAMACSAAHRWTAVIIC